MNNLPKALAFALPPSLFTLKGPLIIGLTKDPARLVQVRRARLRMIAGDQEETDYVDPESVRAEIAFARKLCSQHDWPVIDVSRRSIEETAATIMSHYARHLDGVE